MTLPLLESYREIPLTKGQVAKVSPHRYRALSRYRWFAKWNDKMGTFYAARNIRVGNRYRTSWMHREILGLSADDVREGDHVRSGDTLNNTDDNLRIATRSQQNANQRLRKDNPSGYKGVSERLGRWRARIRIDRRLAQIGTFDTAEEAARAYDTRAREVFGEFSCTNFPLSD